MKFKYEDVLILSSDAYRQNTLGDEIHWLSSKYLSRTQKFIHCIQNFLADGVLEVHFIFFDCGHWYSRNIQLNTYLVIYLYNNILL